MAIQWSGIVFRLLSRHGVVCILRTTTCATWFMTFMQMVNKTRCMPSIRLVILEYLVRGQKQNLEVHA